MRVTQNADLSKFSTMHLGGRATYLTKLHSLEDVARAIEFAESRQIKLRVIGKGSNIVFSEDGFNGLIAVDEIKGIREKTHGEKTEITFASGEVWDEAVAYTVERGLSGIECLSKIPGTVGAAPVQNIGAYGQQLSDCFVRLETYDVETKGFVTLTADECGFGYRSSIFKHLTKQQYIITSVTLSLSKRLTLQRPLYKDIEAELKKCNITSLSPSIIRDIVIDIRSRKLPDPSVVANNGSFFANPIISRSKYDELVKKHPQLNETPSDWPQPPRWFLDDGKVKLAAGWLVEQAGFKDYHDSETGMGTWLHQNLVIINEHASKPADLMRFRDKIIRAVQQKFGVTLEQEPETI